MYTHLRSSGYYIEILGEPFTCFNASNYGTLLLVDPEEEFFSAEITKLHQDVLMRNLSLIVFADWYNTSVMQQMKFYDQNTRQWWIPDTGGANIPALNELMHPFGIEMGDGVLDGYYSLGDHGMYYASGTSITKFPQHNRTVLVDKELTDQGADILRGAPSQTSDKSHKEVAGPKDASAHAKTKQKAIILGLLQTSTEAGRDGGRVTVYGDSNCLDSTHLEKPCFWLLDSLLEYTMTSHLANMLKELNVAPYIKFQG